jgi:hypothetical protein
VREDLAPGSDTGAARDPGGVGPRVGRALTYGGLTYRIAEIVGAGKCAICPSRLPLVRRKDRSGRRQGPDERGHLGDRRPDRSQVESALLIRRGLLDERQGALSLPEIEEDLLQEAVGAGCRGTTTSTSFTHLLPIDRDVDAPLIDARLTTRPREGGALSPFRGAPRHDQIQPHPQWTVSMGSILTSGWPQLGHRRVHIPAPPSEALAMDKRSKRRARAGTAGRVSPKCARMLRWSGASSRARVERCAPRYPMWLGKLLSGHVSKR